MNLLRVYVDGACFPNPGQGGWAWTTLQGQYDSGHEAFTTNNRMELIAPIQAIKSLYEHDQPLLILSDSLYVIKGITEWIEGWIKKGWIRKVKKKEQPVKNQELWQELYELTQGRSIFFEWVRGHSGDPGNEKADRLSVLASKADPYLIKKCQNIWK